MPLSKMNLFLAGIVVLRTISPLLAQAHGGEDHGGPALAAAPAPAAPTGFGAEGSAFQIVAYAAEGKVVLYLADSDSNAPVAGASIDAEAPGFRDQATPLQYPGTYQLTWAPPAEGADLSVVVSTVGKDDLLLVQGVRPPPPNHPAVPTLVAHWTHWVGGGAIGMGAVLILWLLGRYRKIVTALLVLGVSALAGLELAPGEALAHGGEDHGTPAPATPPVQPGQIVTMPKPTQFLLGIRTEKVEPRQAADTVRVVGRVIPDPTGYARVQPSQPARVVGDTAYPIPVPGEVVRKGQIVAVLEPTLTNLEKSDKRASLARVESDLAVTERELVRMETLGGLVPAKQVEATRFRVDQLRKERGHIAGTALGREYLSAPVDGVIADVHVVPGEIVNPAQTLVEVVDPTRLRVEAVIYDLAVSRRVSGASAASKLLPGQLVHLALLGLSPKMDAQDQGLHAVFQVAAGEAEALSIGMPLDVYLETGATRLRTAVPRDAVAEMGGRQVVFVRTAPESFEARPVKVERVVGPLAEISEGVAAGDRVVTQGIEQLKAGR
jgi:RND family efflux transporter MFP subunit